MEEKKKKQVEQFTPGAGGSDDAATSVVGDKNATVSHGPYAEQLPVAGMTVGEVRKRFGDRLDIHPESTPLIGGKAVDPSTRIQAGEVLMFIRRSGEKG